MQLTRYKLGDLIVQRREKNEGYDVPIRGVSREGFIKPKQQEADTSIYNVFYRNDFVFNPARMELNSIALNLEFDKALCSSLYEIFYVKDERIVLPEFLNLHIKRDEFARHCEYIGSGSAREYCRVAQISEFDIDLPPIDVQQKIVDANRILIKRIETNKKLIATLEQTAETLYRHTFVDNIDSNNLPQGWRMGVFTDLVKIGGGGTPSTSEPTYWNDEVMFFTPADVDYAYYTIDTIKKISKKGLSSCSSKLYEENTTFVTARGTVGAIGLAGFSMAMNQSCFALLPKQGRNKFYVHQLSLDTMESLKKEAIGAVFNALTTIDFQKKSIVIPPEKLIMQFDKDISPLYQSIFFKQKENKNLTQMQTLLLSKMGV